MKMKSSISFAVKIALMGVLALLMLIPLAMVQNQIRDRQNAADSSRDEVAAKLVDVKYERNPVMDSSMSTTSPAIHT